MKNRVKELRTIANITQQQLSDLVSVSSRTIISLEKGQYNPSIMLAYKIACVFNTTIEKLYCLKENLENEEKNI
ncbi:helix-turn-helix transcriptional regulator [Clostridium estertheticum]|uniref:Transcriptional regulator n=1 Tax=Clostridium estertheticum TaxID=238834 RepID=A0A5N7IV88_9CLOT|nr:helix-turn-helix transcriptional regulator [Clostridium estertheticum]MBU3075440.1 helix-turn-helix transcriptional regulator [Clostridium estertheticum]MBU3165541.1 helix-turn-helix transcriptional regulator [Clostridium estertheticum]MBU3178609.1 helix-turn-helix transcriptional regulator [Clostridium estertheticum]MBU3217218.1 helix-turn-helix transcriptional regulator [Clostridium estertheticum]MBW9154526.1 helix-turn-helix transcriptional regulator [Clostridium estertheticum]